MILVLKRLYKIELKEWMRVTIFLVVARLLLNLPILLAQHLLPKREELPADYGFGFPEVWARWDSGFYLKIAADGYSLGGLEVNFFPMYPLTMSLLSFGNDGALHLVGYLVSNVAFVAAGVLLWQQLRDDFSPSIAWATVISLSLFPTSFFFSAVYSESLLLLFSVLIYVLSVRKQYFWAAVVVSFASVTRISGVLLVVIPLTEIWVKRPSHWTVKFFLTGAMSALGLAIFGGYLWLTQGHPLAFLLTQQSEMQRTISWPGHSLLNGAGVVLWGHGGFESNWFLRAVSGQDLLALLLFIGLAIWSIRHLKQTSLVVYFWVGLLLLLVSHGPYTLGVYAMARYVLVLFPGFVGMGILLANHRFRYLIWTISTLLLLFLTAWFGNGGWVA